ncbi:MAG: AAA family ATPase [bacterium]|nr:AAA family ATPase [bacterium]
MAKTTKPAHQLADSYRIVGLEAEDFMRLKAVRIAFDPAAHAVDLSGENGQGKTSVIQAIWTALGGAKVTPGEPVHEGAEKATIVLDLAPADDARSNSPRRIRVTRTVTAEGGWGLKIWTPDKGSFPSPQAILDAFYHTLCFDPSEFVRMKAEHQSKVMIDLAGVKEPIDALKTRRQGVYDQRTDVNRDLKAAQLRLDALDMPASSVPEEVSLTELTRQMDAARLVEDAGAATRQALHDLYQEHAEAKAEVARLEIALTAARERVTSLVAQGKEKKLLVDALQPSGLEALRAKLTTAEADNELAREARKYRETEAEVTRLQGESETLTTSIDAVNDEISQVLLSAKLPIDGLAITEDGTILYRGKPFAQASDAERLEVSLAMGAAMHPKLKFLALREASMMTERTRERVKAWATEQDLMVLFELATSQEIGIHIVDGGVAGAGSDPRETADLTPEPDPADDDEG